MAEVETPVVAENEGLAVRRAGGALLERWITATDPAKALEQLETLGKLLDQLRRIAIAQTYPSDWVIHTTKDGDGAITKQVGYLQDSGAERAGKVFAIDVDKPRIEREDIGDGTYAYHMTSPAISKVTGEMIDHVEGSRWSGDPFFQRQIKNPDEDRIDPTDVRKAAYANLHGRAVRALTGLSAVPLDRLEAAGLDIKRCMYVGYDRGAKGGQSIGAQAGGADVTVGFGNSRGKKVSELEAKDLDWYLKAYAENVADTGKAQFLKQNQRVLDALKAEKERRALSAAHEAETGTKPPEPGEGGAAAGPNTRGGKLADLNTKLSDACGDRRLVAPVLRLMTGEMFGKETGSPSELTDEQLEKLAAVDDKVLAAVVAKAKEKK